MKPYLDAKSKYERITLKNGELRKDPYIHRGDVYSLFYKRLLDIQMNGNRRTIALKNDEGKRQSKDISYLLKITYT